MISELQNLRHQKQDIAHTLLQEAAASNNFSQHIHRLYRLAIRYYRMSLINHCVKLQTMDKYIDGIARGKSPFTL